MPGLRCGSNLGDGIAGTHTVTTTGYPAPPITQSGLASRLTFLDAGNGPAPISDFTLNPAGAIAVARTGLPAPAITETPKTLARGLTCTDSGTGRHHERRADRREELN